MGPLGDGGEVDSVVKFLGWRWKEADGFVRLSGAEVMIWECTLDVSGWMPYPNIPSNFLVLNIVKNQHRAHTKPTYIPGS